MLKATDSKLPAETEKRYFSKIGRKPINNCASKAHTLFWTMKKNYMVDSVKGCIEVKKYKDRDFMVV